MTVAVLSEGATLETAILAQCPSPIFYLTLQRILRPLFATLLQSDGLYARSTPFFAHLTYSGTIWFVILRLCLTLLVKAQQSLARCEDLSSPGDTLVHFDSVGPVCSSQSM